MPSLVNTVETLTNLIKQMKVTTFKKILLGKPWITWYKGNYAVVLFLFRKQPNIIRQMDREQYFL